MIKRIIKTFKQDPAKAARNIPRFLRLSTQGQLMRLFWNHPIGCNVLDLDWDFLVVLDTCRVDALRMTLPQYLDIEAEDIGSYWSLGSQTGEWLCKTFSRRDDLDSVAYAAGNAWFSKVFDRGEGPETVGFENVLSPEIYWKIPPSDSFAAVSRLWGRESQRFAANDAHEGLHCPPKVVTDQALHFHKKSHDRIIAHYIQPHFPYEKLARNEGRERLLPHENGPDHIASSGDFEATWEAYLEDLRWVLEDVKELIENVDGTVAITSDHGEAFGELGLYGHGAGNPLPQIKRVPWIRVEGENKNNRSGENYDSKDAERTVLEQLEHLGYR